MPDFTERIASGIANGMVQFGKSAVIAVSILALSACGDPLSGFEDISDVTFAEEEPVAIVPTAAETNRKSGILSRLWSQPEDSVVAEAPVTAEENASSTVAPVALQEDVAEPTPAAVLPEPEATPKPRGLLSWLAGQADKPAVAPDTGGLLAEPEKVEVLTTPVEEASATPEEEAVQLASLSAEDTADTPKPRRGLFARRDQTTTDRAPRRTSAQSPDVPYGIVLEFGKVGRVCEARSKPLGTKVETSGNRGQTYTLYDSAPGSTGQRTFYITGFSDKCPRQFTAALALFGAPVMHEQLRYGRPAVTYPYSETDEAYEKIKSRVCGVGPRTPCGSRIDQLSRNTVFVSTYERFTDNGRWADLLVHDGQIVATAVKWPGQRIQ